MNENQDMEKIYDLLEKFDFRNLSEQERNHVLAEMTAEEYNNLRATLKDTEIHFSNALELEPEGSAYSSLISIKKKKYRIMRILNQPVQLYKVAASIILLTGLFSFVHFTNLHDQKNNSLSNDTIFVYKTDTVYSRIADTLKL